MNEKYNETYKFFVKKGLIRQHHRAQIFPIFSYRLSNNEQKCHELSVSPNKVIHSSINNSLLTISQAPRKNTAYQFYMENIIKKRTKQKQNPRKLQTQSIDSIQGRKVSVIKEMTLPKLTLRRQPQQIKHIKQDLHTEPIMDIQPWEGSQQSFVLY